MVVAVEDEYHAANERNVGRPMEGKSMHRVFEQAPQHDTRKEKRRDDPGGAGSFPTGPCNERQSDSPGKEKGTERDDAQPLEPLTPEEPKRTWMLVVRCHSRLFGHDRREAVK